MEMFTGSGDRGMTSLKRDRNVSKADDRIQAIGEIEDLITHIGMIKLHADDLSLKADLEKITTLGLQENINYPLIEQELMPIFLKASPSMTTLHTEYSSL